MTYEIVELKEKTIVGFAARTSNEDPQMGAIIGDLWKQLYTPENTEKIQNRVNSYAIGLYSNYDKEGYQVTAGFEVSDAKSGNGFTVKTIPAGRYAKFSVHGDMIEAVTNSWKEI